MKFVLCNGQHSDCNTAQTNQISMTIGPASSIGRTSALRSGGRGFRIPGRAIQKALNMVPAASLLGAPHYRATTGFSLQN